MAVGGIGIVREHMCNQLTDVHRRSLSELVTQQEAH